MQIEQAKDETFTEKERAQSHAIAVNFSSGRRSAIVMPRFPKSPDPTKYSFKQLAQLQLARFAPSLSGNGFKDHPPISASRLMSRK